MLRLLDENRTKLSYATQDNHISSSVKSAGLKQESAHYLKMRGSASKEITNSTLRYWRKLVCECVQFLLNFNLLPSTAVIRFPAPLGREGKRGYRFLLTSCSLPAHFLLTSSPSALSCYCFLLSVDEMCLQDITEEKKNLSRPDLKKKRIWTQSRSDLAGMWEYGLIWLKDENMCISDGTLHYPVSPPPTQECVLFT